MSIVSVKQVAAGRSGDSKSDFNRSYTVVWRVVVNNRYDGPATVGSHPAFPARFASYVGYENTDDISALCTSLKPEQDGEDWHLWKVTATFETKFTNQENAPRENPLDDPVVRWIEVEFEKRKVTKEYNGTDIKNTIGQLIDGIEADFAVGTYCFERNEATISPHIKTYNNAVNEDSFYDLDPAEGLLRITAGKPEYRGGIQFYKHLYRVKVNPDGWHIRPANKATGRLGSDGKLITKDNFGDEYGEVYLNASSEIIEPGSGDPIYFLPEKKIYTPRPFATLGLSS